MKESDLLLLQSSTNLYYGKSAPKTKKNIHLYQHIQSIALFH